MTFQKIKSVGWVPNEKLTSAQLNQLDTDHLHSLDKTGDTVAGGGGVTGQIDWTGTASSIYRSGATLSTLSGSSVTINSGTTVAMTLSTGNSITFATGSNLNMNTGSVLNVASGGNLNMASGSTLTGSLTMPSGSSIGFSSGSFVTSAGLTTLSGTTNISGPATLSGGVFVQTRTKSADFTLDSGGVFDYTVVVNNAANAVKVTCPNPSLNTGRIFNIIMVSSAFAITVYPFGTEKVNGVSAFVLDASNYAFFTITCDGTNWFAQSKYL